MLTIPPALLPTSKPKPPLSIPCILPKVPPGFVNEINESKPSVELCNFNKSSDLFSTTNPGAKLDVRGSSGGYLKFDTSSSNGSIKSDFNLQLYADPEDDNSSGYQNIQFFTAGTSEKMRIGYNGRVGIGTTSPGQKLEVNGTVKSSGLHVTAAPRIDATATPGNAAAGQSLSPTQAQVKNGGNPDYYLSEPDEWLVVNISGTDYVLPAYEV